MVHPIGSSKSLAPFAYTIASTESDQMAEKEIFRRVEHRERFPQLQLASESGTATSSPVCKDTVFSTVLPIAFRRISSRVRSETTNGSDKLTGGLLQGKASSQQGQLAHPSRKGIPNSRSDDAALGKDLERKSGSSSVMCGKGPFSITDRLSEERLPTGSSFTVEKTQKRRERARKIPAPSSNSVIYGSEENGKGAGDNISPPGPAFPRNSFDRPLIFFYSGSKYDDTSLPFAKRDRGLCRAVNVTHFVKEISKLPARIGEHISPHCSLYNQGPWISRFSPRGRGKTF